MTSFPQGNASNSNSFKSAGGWSVGRNEDVNAKDANGATQLHRAVSDNNIGRVLALLEHTKIDVNAKDLESGWTALHRALYLGHLRIAVLLVQHKDINLMIEASAEPLYQRDKDRNTALDVCLSTLPQSLKLGPCPADALYTWGTNSNLTLGHNDGEDRKVPVLVKFPYQTTTITFPRAKSAKPTLYHLSMSKFHTVIATSESGLSAKIWGFGTGGRLGSDKKMQLCPAPVPGIQGIVATTALGRDHTVLVTTRGEVFTMGNNKYGQLGYSLDLPKNGQDPVQSAPKRVILAISKLVIKGAAASRWHTALHTENELFTFGFNYGQLGYERKGDIQVGPRKVATIPPGQILQVVASESATACLMASFDVVVFHKYAYHKITFPLSPYPEAFVQSIVKTRGWNSPCKISCSENKFGALTTLGDVFVWGYPEVDSDITLGSLPANHSIPFASVPTTEKPRRVWAYGGDRTHAIDFALGQNGSVILLTKGGHVYIGANKGNSVGRNIKWQRIPHLDRIVQVNANPSGAWAALRSESSLTPVPIRKGCLGADLEQSLSQFYLYQMNEKNQGGTTKKMVTGTSGDDDDDDDGDDDQKVESDPWRIDTQGWVNIEKSWDFDLVPLLDQEATFTSALGNSISGSHLFDVELQAGKRCMGAHRIILAARSPALRRAFVENPYTMTTVGSLVSLEPLSDQSQGRLYTVHLKVEFATAVLLLQFLYSDRIDPFWDAVDLPKPSKLLSLKIRQELYHLALELGLPTLQAALQFSFTHACSPSLSVNLAQVLDDSALFNSLSDVKLLLKNGFSVNAHQVILGHRSPFFNAMFVRTDEWIRGRQGPRRLPPGKVASEVESPHILSVDMKHMSFESMQLVLRYIYSDCGSKMFDGIEKDEMGDLIEVVLNVLQIADEWLMDRLKDICEQVLGEQVRAKTVVNFLEFALMYGAKSLEVTCIDYLCHNIESALDQRWLEEVEDDILVLVENAIKEKQHSMSPWPQYEW
ncbi:hypothetical protein BG006_009294 [Podila minutissima]|uniref:BTB domain-containing protein n=1 Tax=Podila minutissima TaxID=64525 RepID=A0A9P5VQC3_9FUNG|nr:hypothetical protein BG006_009294 [Podila minutissima]